MWLTVQRTRQSKLFNGYPHVSHEGFAVFDETENVPRYRHAIVGREGHVEAAVVLNPFTDKRILPSWWLTEVTLQFLDFCGLLYEWVAYYGMVKLFLSADHIAEMTIGSGAVAFCGLESGKLQADSVYLSREEAAVSLRADQLRICKLLLDRVYQAAGIMACDYFQNGKLVRPRL
jgi:hypothetical protein